MEEVYPTIEITRELGEFETLLSIERRAKSWVTNPATAGETICELVFRSWSSRRAGT